MKFKKRLGQVPGKTAIYLYALFLIVPLYFILITALKSPQEITLNPLGLPESIRWENFSEALVQGKMLRYGFNSVVIAVFGIALSMFNIIMITFCLYKLQNTTIGKILYSLVILGMFIPGVGWVSTLKMYQALGLYNKTIGVIIANGFSSIPFGVFIVYGFMKTLPRELEEAAYIDGCTDFGVLRHILIPLIKPALITVGIFNFVANWNNLLTPLLLLNDSSKYTLPIGMLAFRGTYSVDYNLVFAAVIIAGAPLVLLYLRFQKHFVDSLTGSVKG